VYRFLDDILVEMSELTPPRSRSVTTAAVLMLITSCFWLAVSGLTFWWRNDLEGAYAGLQKKLIVAMALLGCMSLGTVIVGLGILFRRNWARIVAVMLAGPWILFGWSFLNPLLRLPDPLAAGGLIIAMNLLPIIAGIAWLALLVGERARAEFLPPPTVRIYVNLLGEGPARTRPARALAWGYGLFELLPAENYDPKVEHWEFPPGSFVHGMKEHRDGEPYLLAVSLDS
jgi:hypothetical protein